MCTCERRTTALCALVGQALGTLAGDTLFLMLESARVLTLSGQSQSVISTLLPPVHHPDIIVVISALSSVSWD